jgi:hypothetical protein
MSEDGTWDGASVVCDACYIELQPFTPSGHAEYDELPEAIRHYREQVAFARQHADPQALVKEAEDMISKVTPRTPLHRSAVACKRIAQQEITRRKRIAQQEITRRAQSEVKEDEGG